MKNTALGQLCLCWRCWCSFLFLVISGNWTHLNFTIIKKKTHPQTVLFHVVWIIHEWADGSAHIVTNWVSLHTSILLWNIPYSVPWWLKQYIAGINTINFSTKIPHLQGFIKTIPSQAICLWNLTEQGQSNSNPGIVLQNKHPVKELCSWLWVSLFLKKVLK